MPCSGWLTCLAASLAGVACFWHASICRSAVPKGSLRLAGAFFLMRPSSLAVGKIMLTGKGHVLGCRGSRPCPGSILPPGPTVAAPAADGEEAEVHRRGIVVSSSACFAVLMGAHMASSLTGRFTQRPRFVGSVGAFRLSKGRLRPVPAPLFDFSGRSKCT